MAIGVGVVVGAPVVHKQAVDVTVDVAASSGYAGSWGGEGNGACSGSRHRGGSRELAFIKKLRVLVEKSRLTFQISLFNLVWRSGFN